MPEPTPRPRRDQLILDVAHERHPASDGDVVVLDDPDGVLTGSALDLVHTGTDRRVLLGSRDVRSARAAVATAEATGMRDRILVAGVDGPLDLPAFLTGARETRGGGVAPGHDDAPEVLVLTHLPKALAELDHLARAVASALPRATFVAGGNTAHMTRSQNDVLAGAFGEVGASRGQGKFRCLVARAPRPGVTPRPPAVEDSPWGPVTGVGGVFGGPRVDRGGRFLVDSAVIDIRRRGARGASSSLRAALDLGGGNGSVSLALGAAFPDLQIIATDVAADAVLSAEATLAPLGPRATVLWSDAADTLDDSCVDLVLLNPPFHEGTRIDATLVRPLLDAAHRMLRPGGAMYLVHNSHLRYRPALEARFASVEQIDRDPTFTVLRAHR